MFIFNKKKQRLKELRLTLLILNLMLSHLIYLRNSKISSLSVRQSTGLCNIYHEVINQIKYILTEKSMDILSFNGFQRLLDPYTTRHYAIENFKANSISSFWWDRKDIYTRIDFLRHIIYQIEDEVSQLECKYKANNYGKYI